MWVQKNTKNYEPEIIAHPVTVGDDRILLSKSDWPRECLRKLAGSIK